jgi:hypothetical protein
MHALHGPPLLPQLALLIAVTHWPVEVQQPAAQVVGPQDVPWQLPALQCVLPPQTLQLSPFLPQVASSRPGRQSAPSQHPRQLLQLPLHWPALQVSAPHATHAAPLVPQAVAAVPGRQTAPSQQPVQVEGSQAQDWLAHRVPAAHVAQLSPPAPQAVFSVPSTQTPPRQQPLLHVVGPQLPVPRSRPLSPVGPTLPGHPQQRQITIATHTRMSFTSRRPYYTSSPKRISRPRAPWRPCAGCCGRGSACGCGPISA